MSQNTAAFAEWLPEQEYRGIQIVIGGLLLGAALFAVVAVLALQGLFLAGQEAADPALPMEILAVVVVFATMAGLFGSVTVPDRIMTAQFSQASALAKENREDMFRRQISAIRSGLIIQFAILEGIAFLGLTFNLIAGFSGIGFDSWVVWVNFLPTILLFLRTRSAFPSKGRIVELHRHYSQLV
jgi:hypothetical protein